MAITASTRNPYSSDEFTFPIKQDPKEEKAEASGSVGGSASGGRGNAASVEIELAYEFGKLKINSVDLESATASLAAARVKTASGLVAPLELYSRTVLGEDEAEWQDRVYAEANNGLRIVCRESSRELVLSDHLSAGFLRRLLRLLQEGRRSETEYNCRDGAHELCGQPRLLPRDIAREAWTFQKLGEDRYKPEDTVCLIDDKGTVIHAATCLGKGLAGEMLYISIWGNGGSLYISTLSSMGTAFTHLACLDAGTTVRVAAFRATPKPFELVLQDHTWSYLSFQSKEKDACEKFAKECVQKNEAFFDEALSASDVCSLYFFNVHAVALQKFASLLSNPTTFKHAKQAQVVLCDTIGDTPKTPLTKASSKIICLTNFLPPKNGVSVERFIAQIQRCLLAETENLTLNLASTIWKFTIVDQPLERRAEILSLLRNNGYSAGIERPYAVVEGQNVTAQQYIWLTFAKTQEKAAQLTSKPQFSAHNLLKIRQDLEQRKKSELEEKRKKAFSDFAQKDALSFLMSDFSNLKDAFAASRVRMGQFASAAFAKDSILNRAGLEKTKKADTQLSEMVQDFETISAAQSALRFCRFNVYDLSLAEQHKVVHFLQSRGFTTFFDPTFYRTDEQGQMVSKQDLVIAL